MLKILQLPKQEALMGQTDYLPLATTLAANRGLATSLVFKGEPQYGSDAKLLGMVVTAEARIAEVIRVAANKALIDNSIAFTAASQRLGVANEYALQRPWMKQYQAPKEIELFDPNKKVAPRGFPVLEIN